MKGNGSEAGDGDGDGGRERRREKQRERKAGVWSMVWMVIHYKQMVLNIGEMKWKETHLEN